MLASRIATGVPVLVVGMLLASMAVPARAQVCRIHQWQKIVASDEGAADQFGLAVAIGGDQAVIGAAFNNIGGSDTGSAYIFRLDDNDTPFDPTDDAWVEQVRLTASDPVAGDRFGKAVGISGDRVVIGAPQPLTMGNGAAYVFRRDDNGTPTDPSDDTWIEEDKLSDKNGAAGDQFGEAVSISGDRIVVGAKLDDDEGSASGSAFVFRLDDSGTPSNPNDDSWVEEDKLNASDAAVADYFGHSVSIDGGVIAVGAPRNRDEDDWSGSAYVFRRDDNDTPFDPTDDFWFEEDKLVPSDLSANDRFGYSVSINGDTVVIGAFNVDNTGSGDLDGTGAAYIFAFDDNGTPLDPTDDSWLEQDKLLALDGAAGDRFGMSVSLSGDWAIAGAEYDDDGCTGSPDCESGSAYAFRRNDNGTPSDPLDDIWYQEAKLTSTEIGFNDWFGCSVSISDDRVMVGASLDDFLDDVGEGSGSAHLFSVTDECRDVASYSAFQNCFSGAGRDPEIDCWMFDFDGDEDVDLDDYHELLGF